METIKDIAAEMRELATQRDWHNHTNQSNRERVLDFADRIEAAVKREREATCKESRQVGNAAKMREALKVAHRTLKLVDENAVEFFQPRLADEIIHAGSAIIAALAEPVLNCEFGTEEEQIERWKEFCNKFKKCHGCPCIRDGEVLSSLSARCFARWAQMPYEEATK